MARWRRRSYWDEWSYYYPPTKPKVVKDGIKAKSQRGVIGEKWWSKRWVDVLESFNLGARLARGRSYARRGQVVSIEVEPGLVTAKVQGSQPRPYTIHIRLTPLSDAEWDTVTDAMAAQAVFAAKLLAGEMPQNIEDAFREVRLSLLPTKQRDLETDCSCPDWSNPCKHIAAVYYLLAERFDEDPFLIFKLRGRTKDAIIEALREKRAQTLPPESEPSAVSAESHPAVAPLDACLDTFWQAGEGLDSFTVNLAPPAVDVAILTRLGAAPVTIGSANLAALLVPAYRLASGAATRKAGDAEA